MKTIKLYLLCILSILFTAGCSNDTDLEYQSTKLEDLQFHVNVINKSDYIQIKNVGKMVILYMCQLTKTITNYVN